MEHRECCTGGEQRYGVERNRGVTANGERQLGREFTLGMGLLGRYVSLRLDASVRDKGVCPI